MFFFNSPFFWAMLSMIGLVSACIILNIEALGKYAIVGLAAAALFDSGRLILVLPFISQPRFSLIPLNWIIGGTLFAAGSAFSTAIMQIKPFTAPSSETQLVTTGFYKITRHPVYLGELLLFTGLSIMFQSVIGVALTPVWWAGLLLYAFIEEKKMERELGEQYIEYKRNVRGRIIPGMSF